MQRARWRTRGQGNPLSAEEVRAKSKNTLLASCAILSKEGLRNLVQLIVFVFQPLYTQHSDNESEVRSPQQTLTFYRDMAVGAWRRTLKDIVSLLQDIGRLDTTGFRTDWSFLTQVDKVSDLDFAMDE